MIQTRIALLNLSPVPCPMKRNDASLQENGLVIRFQFGYNVLQERE